MKIWELVFKVKKDYMKKFNAISYEKVDNKTCLENWIEKLDNIEYKKIFSYLNIKQKDNFLLFKYKDYEKLFYLNVDLQYKDFWHLYDGIFRECRGLVLDIKNEKIVCLPYEKFFNIDEQAETKEEVLVNKIKNAHCIEFANKLDGSLIISRYYNDNFFICSSGSMEKEESYPLQYANNTIMNKSNYQKLLNDFKDWTILFECITANNQLVVIYSKEDYGLHLIGMRNVITGELKPYSEIVTIAKNYNIPTTSKYNLSFEEILESRDKYKHTEKEGYVMYLDGQLVKIKCNEYILLHKRGKDSISKNDILKAFYFNTIDDLLSGSSLEMSILIKETLGTIKEYCSLMESKTCKLFETMPKERKEFFLSLKNQPKMFQKFLSAKYLNRSYSYLVELEAGESTSFIRYMELERRLKQLKENNF